MLSAESESANLIGARASQQSLTRWPTKRVVAEMRAETTANTPYLGWKDYKSTAIDTQTPQPRNKKDQ